MTEDELKAIEARTNAATPGPWSNEYPYKDRTKAVSYVSGGHRWHIAGYCNSVEDATFIAHSREDMPALIAEVRRLQEEINRVAIFLAIHGVSGYELRAGE